MFARVKQSGNGEYLQVVEAYREDGRVRQRLVLYVGHYDSLENALWQMPQERRRWRAEATRTDNDDLRRDADALDRRLDALRRLVAEHPDILERDRRRAERHRRRRVPTSLGRPEAHYSPTS